MTKNSKVDEFIRKTKKWPKELALLRTILLDSPLTEEWKWYHPCYTFQNTNVIVLGGFKEYCALMLFKGALLKDPQRILVQPGRSQAARQIRFTSVQDIVKMIPVLKAYIKEAIEAEKAGLKVQFKKTSDFKIPEEFQKKLEEMPALKKAFEALTPGRQRAYIFYFSDAKQSQTRASRVEKWMKPILKGKGLDD